MQILKDAADLLLHLDDKLRWLIGEYGTGVYLILFLIVFAETGLVVTPFLPGDSLLFAAGVFAGSGSLHLGVLFPLFLAATFAGDNTNYWIGKAIGPKVFSKEETRFLKRSHLERTHAFFERYGGKTVILARFVPIVRTFAPFVAGVGAMTYPRFLAYSVAGSLLWVSVCCLAGYFLGHLPIVRDRFELAILAIIAISVLPAAYELLKHRREARQAREAAL